MKSDFPESKDKKRPLPGWGVAEAFLMNIFNHIISKGTKQIASIPLRPPYRMFAFKMQERKAEKVILGLERFDFWDFLN